MTQRNSRQSWLLVFALLGICCFSTSSNAQSPSFDCSMATSADEKAICRTPQLVALDLLLARGYAQLKQRLGMGMANRIHLPFLRARHACKDDAFCIFQRQMAEIPTFTAMRAQLTLPPRVMAPNPPTYEELKKLVKVGECSAATITDISYRLCEPDENEICIPQADTGSTISLSNGINGVDYESIEAIKHSLLGDQVVACLIKVPQDCPVGDDRGYEWRMSNLRTGESWQMADAQHVCGGA